MSRMSEYDLLKQDYDHNHIMVGDLHEIAEKLGGDVVDGRVVCPSPGKPLDDRSCEVRIDPAQPSRFFIYYCDGSLGAAYRAIREKLELAAPSSISEYERGIQVDRIWRETVSATGTIVETYLRSRAITLPVPPSLRFHPRTLHTPSKNWLPAMVAARTDRSGSVVAIHRTFLRFDGRGKADVKSQRMDLGPKRGSAIRLAEPIPDKELAIGEGIETVFSVMIATGLPGWAGGSARDLAQIELPDDVRRVLILADGDDVGERAARQATHRLLSEGRQVRIARAPRGKDFNDLLRAGK
ncbi:MAG: toprim domain-containing protein [Xanthobacteraceae bacterium]